MYWGCGCSESIFSNYSDGMGSLLGAAGSHLVHQSVAVIPFVNVGYEGSGRLVPNHPHRRTAGDVGFEFDQLVKETRIGPDAGPGPSHRLVSFSEAEPLVFD